MPKRTPIINDFRAGELTPIVDARADLKDYYRGCRILENAMPIIEGGVARVPGTYYVRPAKQIEEGWSLRVTKSGTGTGVVASDLSPGINCGSSCYYFFSAGATAILTATPDSGSSFAGWSGDGTGTATRSVLMDGNKVVNAGFSLGDPYLIGWYKFDEGSGLVVNNYAANGSLGGGLLPNLAVVQNDGAFWTFLSGFGSTQDIVSGAGDGLVDFAWANPNRTIGGANKSCFGMFVRAKASGYDSGAGGLFMRTNDVVTLGSGGGIYISNENEGKWQSIGFGSKPYQWEGGAAENLGRWHFHFINSNGQWCVVRPEGNKLVLLNVILTDTLNFHWMFAGCRYANASPPTLGSYPGGGSYGDWIIYNQKVLTNTEWAAWYDLLRSRYGMAVRSGW